MTFLKIIFEYICPINTYLFKKKVFQVYIGTKIQKSMILSTDSYHKNVIAPAVNVMGQMIRKHLGII